MSAKDKAKYKDFIEVIYISKENSITQEILDQNVKSFKYLLDEQYKSAKDYNPKIEWFEGAWSSYKPKKGKDKRGITGADKEILKNI